MVVLIIRCPSKIHFRYMLHPLQIKIMIKVTWKFAFCNIFYYMQEVWPKYVGEMGQPLHCRTNSHCWGNMHRRTEDSLVAAQFNNDSHSQADMTVMVLDQLDNHDPCLCNTWESRWIRTMRTSSLSGMSLQVDSLWSLLPLSVDSCGVVCPLIIKCVWVSHESYSWCMHCR